MATANAGRLKNKKRTFYRKWTSSSDGNSYTPAKVAVRKMIFHMHDSAQRKTLKSFGRIKEALILKIQKTFDDPIVLAQSISENTKKIFKKTEIQKSVSADPSTKLIGNMIYMEDFKIDLQSTVIIVRNLMRHGPRFVH